MGEEAAILKLKSIWKYLLIDFLSVVAVWLMVMLYRNNVLVQETTLAHYLQELRIEQWLKYFVLVPLFWLLLFACTGTYRYSIYEKSRLNELVLTFLQSFIGCLFLFFSFFLKDNEGYPYFFKIFLFYFLLQFTVVYTCRLLQLFYAKSRIEKGLFYFKTIFIGGQTKMLKAYENVMKYYTNLGYKIAGYIPIKEANHNILLKPLGAIDNLLQIIDKNNVQQVIIALENDEIHRLPTLINTLSEKDLLIKIVAEDIDIISGSVKTNSILSAPFINIDTTVMDGWQYNIKQVLDKIIAIFAIAVLSPLILFVAIRTYFSVKGSLIYQQQRIGYKGRPFTMYKFRSMVVNAEADGPMLSSKNDMRITSWGRIMRRWRLDELPQFWNIIKGDMSLVGPRPERKYFIDKISEENNYYKYLLKVRPGLTSWGMVRFGYASNIEEMKERMKYDLMYVENASLNVDFKILLHTIKIILSGTGK